MSGQLKKRGQKKTGTNTPPVAAVGGVSSRPIGASDFDELEDFEKPSSIVELDQERKYYIACTVITLVATYLRFSNISYPAKVVFDEVHFGKFASYYLEGTYFFDLHPPFAKLLIAFVGYLVGYDGKFKFDNIGDNFSDHPDVPYVAYRALSALQGTAVVPLLFWTLKTLNFSVPACVLASAIVCFDNAHVIDSRLILLDSTLILSVALTIFTYVKFSTFRRQPFSKNWWIWLYATGVSLSCVISTKYVGVFTYVTIGIGVLHELWILLDYEKKIPMQDLIHHFLARLWALIAVPFAIYLFWFYLHFNILTKSGPGDTFMSLEFQETLLESPLAKESKPVYYWDEITLNHRQTEAYLHSHTDTYPLRYEDGRISSQGQQITCVFNKDNNEPNDANNWWQIIPQDTEKKPFSNTTRHKVFTEDIVRFRHVQTGGYLLAHDVASPLKATHEEFTAVYDDVANERFNETLFKLKFTDKTKASSNSNKRIEIKSRATTFKVIHVDTVVAMWSHDDDFLPDWGYHHQEVSGNKKVQDADVAWRFNEIKFNKDDERAKFVPKAVTKLPFLKKWWELQFLMFHHNNQLSSDHPFASQPDSWPLAVSGVSFWNDNDLKRQIFFIGNIIGFWVEVGFLAIYVGLLLADQVTRRRGVFILNDKARSRLYNTCGFFFAGWCAHYLPFFLMNRQKFLHHYLPAHLIAALFTGSIAEFICTNNTKGKGASHVNKVKIGVLVGSIIIGLGGFFFYFRAITYGDVTVPPEELIKREWLDIKLHYTK
ncbi:dolichyl-phosphate-mannose--protein mannosyltransferase 4 [[Candida] railenensis]|uniref:Dolichyl-phosphate-mannose--protein mannosyltransferase n=1 Tax=[Candida] railenensis TaxID=45579 RepID=A0A9P0QKW9_9ASCO|nr:dolichyl-phosphate-mannose--protein mannosyltransferase 4 [[Candida] railenensis]